jgi:hypothetical protein
LFWHRNKPTGEKKYLWKCGCSSGVEHNLAKVGVEGSNPFARSNDCDGIFEIKNVGKGRVPDLE